MVRIRDEWLAELEREDAEASRLVDDGVTRDRMPSRRQQRLEREKRTWGAGDAGRIPERDDARG